jgi:transposase
MRLGKTVSKTSTRLYALKSIYDPKTQKSSSKIVHKFGTAEKIMEERGCGFDEAIEWAKSEIARMDAEEQASKEKPVTIVLNPERPVEKGARRRVNAGYFFPRKIISELRLRDTCDKILGKSNFEFDLGSITEALVLGRMLEPASKLATFKWATQNLIEEVEFKEHQVYRALSVLAEHSDEIQAALYKASKKISKRRDGILYYDCTNYFFEIDGEDLDDGLRQYGISKQNQPKPIVEMGLFTDADGIPLAFRMSAGNTNEQKTMRPLEQTIISDFEHAQFVVCTDGGLGSSDNRLFNTQGGRSFICVQSIKKMPAYLKDWALERTGWKLGKGKKTYDLREADEVAHWEDIFYKERWVKGKEGEADQRFVATFSFKYKEYLASIREGQLERAQKRADKGVGAVERKRENDPMRFVEVEHVTKDGEVCDKSVAKVNKSKADEEAHYDGFSCLATNLEDDVSKIIAVNKRRWQIEDCFRVMKTEFKARPVYLSRDERIEAHFLTCFIALLVERLLKKRLAMKDLTCERLLNTLRGMQLLELKGEGYLPAYEDNDVTQALYEKFGFATNWEIITYRRMRSIVAMSKEKKITK